MFKRKNSNPVAIIQARTGSSRFPNKVLATLSGNNTMLDYVVKRTQQSKNLKGIVIATTKKMNDQLIVDLANSLGVNVYRGSEDDVLKRYMNAAISENADPVIRITSDCPLIDPAIIDQCIDIFFKESVDYVTVDVSKNGYPRGLDCEVLSFSALQQTFKETNANQNYYREHVTSYVYTHPNKFKKINCEPPVQFKNMKLRLCVDEKADYEVVRHICEYFAPRLDFNLEEIQSFLTLNQDIATLNQHVQQKNSI
ncbi:acylneuraminate cytidylyltransferase [Candidatus Magnetomorum sp. HK-1]|nr:acylneuraminate cytidylyltransferase [Candidatus Magnetomorum sp. HK-1]